MVRDEGGARKKSGVFLLLFHSLPLDRRRRKTEFDAIRELRPLLKVALGRANGVCQKKRLKAPGLPLNDATLTRSGAGKSRNGGGEKNREKLWPTRMLLVILFSSTKRAC